MFRERFGLTIIGGLVHAIRRAADRAAPIYEALRETVRGSPVVMPDETGWKVSARLQWLWAAATLDTTIYAVQPGRGFSEAATLLSGIHGLPPAVPRILPVPASEVALAYLRDIATPINGRVIKLHKTAS